ncbi:TadE/TadG family type IV pilus assembly protein [Cutibacterium equinum]|uniref:TadE/TadG family type IV pilus assembly protein n=1 Tax=Cutibacterium equinum TaxID=3016342 RepID=A0ABY7QZU0_9ACTN|nr:TadE/TadG family type IV pilus assembly protein [Cutibacterium equinum]WCC80007.1 TadE/TadG family type IV pilus assembly protein [Cutibacterium equinum]
MIGRGRLRGHQRGAVAVEAALILPSLLMIAAVTAGGWRLSEVRADAQSAAEAAARAGSVAATVDEGHTVGQHVAETELAGTRCSDPAVTIDSSALATPVGSTGVTSARVRCTVRLADLLVPGIPGALHVESTAHSTVDSHRERHT